MSTTMRRLWAALHLGGLSPREVVVRTYERINEHEILTRAAAITFYGVAALVPFLALVITLTAYLLPTASPASSGPARTGGPADILLEVLPADAASVVAKEIRHLQDGPPAALVSFGLLATLWLSSSLFVGIMDALNRILGVRETRPWWKQRLVAVLMSLSQAAILIVVFATIVAWPQILGFLGIDLPTALAVTAVHAVLVLLVFLLSFALALYLAPDAKQCWEWITPGSLLGSVFLLAISYLFRVYVQNWGNYSATYGSLGGIVVLMSWIWLCALALLTAAEINKVIKDATPLGDSCEPGPSHEDRHARASAPQRSERGEPAARG